MNIFLLNSSTLDHTATTPTHLKFQKYFKSLKSECPKDDEQNNQVGIFLQWTEIGAAGAHGPAAVKPVTAAPKLGPASATAQLQQMAEQTVLAAAQSLRLATPSAVQQASLTSWNIAVLWVTIAITK